jgi:hypothetical protein
MRYCAMDFLLPTARAAFPAPAAEKRTSHMHAPSAISNPAASTDLGRRHPVPGVGLVWDAWVWGGWGLGLGLAGVAGVPPAKKLLTALLGVQLAAPTPS